MIRIFIGFDPAEAVAYQVLSHSIIARTTTPVSIAPLALHELKSIHNRPRDPLQSTDFSFTRFLVPHLAEFEGFAIYMDCDMLLLDDIARLWELQDARYAVQVVQHDHRPAEDHKFMGNVQTRYSRKNWSSLMLMNASACRALTADYVNTAPGLDLHGFRWLTNDRLIGSLPARWNHLVDYSPALPVSDISIRHYTNGGPYCKGYEQCGYADLWFAEQQAMNKSRG